MAATALAWAGVECISDPSEKVRADFSEVVETADVDEALVRRANATRVGVAVSLRFGEGVATFVCSNKK